MKLFNVALIPSVTLKVKTNWSPILPVRWDDVEIFVTIMTTGVMEAEQGDLASLQPEGHLTSRFF